MKLKQQKNAYKTHLTSSIQKLTGELAKPEKDRKNDLLKQYLNQVEIKHEKWESSMMRIQEEDTEADIGKSMNEIDQILDEVITLKVRTEETLKGKVKEEPKPGDEAKEKMTKVKDKVNLPKIELKKFSGTDIEYFQEWFQIFHATIEKSSLSTVEKFIYLKMSLEKGSEAEKLIDGYPVTKENYEIALKDLHEAYGDPQIVINHHVSKLLTLPQQSDFHSLKDLYTVEA